MKKFLLMVVMGLILISPACGDQSQTEDTRKTPKTGEETAMKISSPAFAEAETIPVKYTCDSIDVSPPLIIDEVPRGTVSLALICDDPDAPSRVWVHWVVYNIPPGVRALPEGIAGEAVVEIEVDSVGIKFYQGMTDFGRVGYGGPCPPRGPAHRYYFKLYALDTQLDIPEQETRTGITKEALLKRMEDHILAEAMLMGKYARR